MPDCQIIRTAFRDACSCSVKERVIYVGWCACVMCYGVHVYDCSFQGVEKKGCSSIPSEFLRFSSVRIVSWHGLMNVSSVWQIVGYGKRSNPAAWECTCDVHKYQESNHELLIREFCHFSGCRIWPCFWSDALSRQGQDSPSESWRCWISLVAHAFTPHL